MNRRVVVYLQGGLGNQLFQYATALALAKHRGAQVLIDDRHFGKAQTLGETPRQLALTDFFDSCRVMNAEEQKALDAALRPPLFQRVLHRMGLPRAVRAITDSDTPHTDIGGCTTLFLKGYFQREEWFSAIRGELLSSIAPRFAFARQLQLPEQAVSVHVRRGDYVTLASAAAHHGTCSPEYYRAAIHAVRERYSDAAFCFFSDDIEWCKQTFSDVPHVHFFSAHPQQREGEDLWWMSRCAHHIIANSSYSWWAAWLNPSPTKMVVAPAKWLASQTTERNNTVPSPWIQL
jgi:Glycosyl transferase family 11